MRLVYFHDRPFPAPLAAPIQILNTCRAAAELGAEVTVYVRRLDAPSEEECLSYYGLTPHPRLRIVSLAALWSARWSGRKLRRALRRACVEDGPVAIVSRGYPGAGPQVAGLLPRVDGGRGWRFVLELHHLNDPRGFDRQAIASADGFVCVNRQLAEELERGAAAGRPLLVLPSGANVPGELRAVGSRDIDVLFAGKLGEGQGVQVAVAAMRHLPSRRLLVLGGTPREVQVVGEQARRLGVGDRVVLEGFVPPAEVPRYLARARVGVCPYPTPSRGESEFLRPGGSLKLLELLANGVPAVASDLAWIRDLATHGLDAWLVEPDSPEALAEGIRGILEDPGLAARLVAAGRERALAFSWERRASRLLQFLDSLESSPGIGLHP